MQGQCASPRGGRAAQKSSRDPKCAMPLWCNGDGDRSRSPSGKKSPSGGASGCGSTSCAKRTPPVSRRDCAGCSPSVWRGVPRELRQFGFTSSLHKYAIQAASLKGTAPETNCYTGVSGLNLRPSEVDGTLMNHQGSQPSVPQWSQTIDYQRVVIPVEKFAGVRGRVLNALRAQPQSVSLQQAMEQIRRFQTMPVRSR